MVWMNGILMVYVLATESDYSPRLLNCIKNKKQQKSNPSVFHFSSTSAVTSLPTVSIPAVIWWEAGSPLDEYSGHYRDDTLRHNCSHSHSYGNLEWPVILTPWLYIVGGSWRTWKRTLPSIGRTCRHHRKGYPKHRNYTWKCRTTPPLRSPWIVWVCFCWVSSLSFQSAEVRLAGMALTVSSGLCQQL